MTLDSPRSAQRCEDLAAFVGPPSRPLPGQTLRHAALARLASLACALAGGCLDDTQSAVVAPGETSGRGMLVVGGDYQTTVLSRVDLDRAEVVAPAFLHSGSYVGRSGAALSGDVVVGQAWLAAVPPGVGPVADDSRAVVVDRGRGVVTILAGLQPQVQRDVAGGFFANPQEAIAIGPTLWVVRGQRAPATYSAGPLGGGDDVLRWDEGPLPSARLPLGPHATVTGGHAMGGSAAWDGAQLWLPLASMRDDFQAAGPGRVLRLTLPASGPAVVVGATELPALRNCRAARAGRDLSAAVVAVVCSGVFADGLAAQVASSGVAVLGATGALVREIPAAAIGKRPLGFAIAVDDGGHAWVTTLGALDDGSVDALWRIDLAEGGAVELLRATSAFTFGGVLWDAVASRLWLTDHNATAGDLLVLSPRPDGGSEVERRASNPGGLRALELGRW